jgi:hypothetical protein
MSYIAIAGGAISIGSALYGGYQATQNAEDVSLGKSAAWDLQQQQLNLLGDTRTLAKTTATGQRDLGYAGAELGYDVSQSEFRAGQRNIGMGTNMALRRAQAFGDQGSSRSNMAFSGTVQQQVGQQQSDLWSKYKSDTAKLYEGKEFAGREKELSIKGADIGFESATGSADLAYRRGKMSASDQYERTITELESTPTTFWEGIFG